MVLAVAPEDTARTLELLAENGERAFAIGSLVGGATAAQGGPSNPDDSYATVLSRNIEDYNFGRDEIHTKVTELTSDYVGNHIKTGNASGELDAWFIHIAEGVDERSRAEFDILVQNNLLVGELV